jgi:hypothetical protein
VAINVGYIEGTAQDNDVVVRIYYDETAPHDTDAQVAAQPLKNGPNGFCLEVTNKSGRRASVSVGAGGAIRDVTIPKGAVSNPWPGAVTNGAARSRTAAQVASQFGFTTRGDIDDFSLSAD